MIRNRERAQIDREIAHLIPLFFENRRERLIEALKCCEAGDFDCLHHIGHDFKGSSASYGFQHLSSLGKELEYTTDLKRARILVEQMQSHLDNVKVEYV